MKKMNLKNNFISPQGEDDPFARLVENVFLFIHSYYPRFNAVLEKHQVNYSQYAALLTLYMYGRLTEGELARLLHVNPSTMSRMVYVLEQRGWLKGVRDSADRRRVLVALTPRGRQKVKEMMRQPAEILSSIVEEMEPERREQIKKVVELINQALRQMIETGAH